MASAVFLFQPFAALPGGVNQDYSSWYFHHFQPIPRRGTFRLCPCPIPRLASGHALSSAHDHLQSLPFPARQVVNLSAARLKARSFFPIVIDQRLIPQCIRFFAQRIVAGVHIVSASALAVAIVWFITLQSLCCCGAV